MRSALPLLLLCSAATAQQVAPCGADVAGTTAAINEQCCGSDDAGEAMRFRKRAGAAKADSARVIGHLVGGACV